MVSQPASQSASQPDRGPDRHLLIRRSEKFRAPVHLSTVDDEEKKAQKRNNLSDWSESIGLQGLHPLGTPLVQWLRVPVYFCSTVPVRSGLWISTCILIRYVRLRGWRRWHVL